MDTNEVLELRTTPEGTFASRFALSRIKISMGLISATLIREG